jgi:CubicO group peptidase (beta-lactamase class C family)
MIAGLAALALAAASAAADETATGLDAKRLARIDQAVQGYIDSGAIPGAVTLVAQHGKIAHVTVQGARDFETKTPMTRDTIFRIYSMSKPITSVAVLMLYEEGKLRLTDPVSKWIPELANRNVLRDPAGPLDAVDPSPSEITVRDLLTHCSGLAYFFTAQGPLSKAYEETFGREATNASISPSEWVKRLSALPLAYAPGTRWNYSVSMDVLGVLVERVSGMPFADFLRTRLFEPLGMKDTAFYVPESKLGRLATNYIPDANGKLRVFDAPMQTSYRKPPAFGSGGGGLVSTLDDYGRFALMLAGNGALEGKRLLSRKAVELMRTNQLSDREREGFGFAGGRRVSGGAGFGLGVSVVEDVGATRGMGSIGKNGWGGAAGTWYWVDPKEDLAAVLMVQRMDFGRPPNPMARDFETAVYQALD